MTYFFIVQGEGRGHLTQAISLFELLIQNGNNVLAMAIGGENQAFVQEQVGQEVNIYKITGPKLAYGRKNSGLSVSKTILDSIKNSRKYIGEIQKFRKLLQIYKPDAVINFYEPLAGLYKLFNPLCKIPFYAIAHQYLLLKSGFEFPQKTKKIEKILLNSNSKITALGSTKKLALSFDQQVSLKNIEVVSPLLRKSIKCLIAENKGHFLVYLTHECMLPDLLNWKLAHPSVLVHCFVRREGKVQLENILPNLFLHQPNTNGFAELFRTCAALASTAGFEIISEAVFLDKPVLMVPVKNHFEQKCNAHDGERYGLGLKANSFDLEILMEAKIRHNSKSNEFKNWLQVGEKRLLKALKANTTEIKPVHFQIP